MNRRDLMKYSIATGILATDLATQLRASENTSTGLAEFYVSPNGSDANPGTLELPFATLERARDAVRGLKASSGTKLRGITIWLRGGRYELSQTFVLEPEDSGTEEYPTTWSAYADERPILSGGVPISDWRRVTENVSGLSTKAIGKVWVAPVPKERSLDSRHLWRNGNRLIRARWPKDGGELESPPKTSEASFRVVDGLYPAHEDLADPVIAQKWRAQFTSIWRTVEFFPLDYLDTSFSLPADLGSGTAELFTRNDGRWATMRIPIAKVRGSKLTMGQPMGCFSYYWHGMRMMSSIQGTGHVENALSLLEQPGEWYLDRTAKVVYYIPPDGEDPNDQAFIASHLDKLLWLRGTPNAQVSFVRMKGLRFENADWKLPILGYRPTLGCYYGSELTPLVARTLPLPAGSIRPIDEYPEYCLQAAVDLTYARGCVLDTCAVNRCAATGVGLGEGCIGNQVLGCEVSDVGGHGIHVGLAHGALCAEDFAWQRSQDEPQGNQVENCYVHDNGHMDWGAYGIFSSYSQRTRIAHNLVTNQPYSGIAASFSLFCFPSGKDYQVTVENNHIHHVMQKLDDGGGLYTKDGMSADSVIAGNLIHDIGGHHFGVYLDDKSYGPHLTDNMIHAETPFYFNSTSKEKFTWGPNYSDHFPAELEKKAGLQEPYKSTLLRGTQPTPVVK